MAATLSEARMQANRKNAQRSTGPRTPEGKARSRANAVKHGLTGAGVALPTEDAAAIEARFLDMQAEFGPTTLEGALLIHLAALMSLRFERAARQEAAALAMVIRHAATEFDLARLAEIDRLFDTIETNPREHHRRLQTTIEGVDLLLAALQGVRDQVESGYYMQWTGADRNKIDAFLGGSVTRFPISRCDAVLLALQGNPCHISPREQAKLPTGDARERYFGDELILLVDVEMARLEKVRATIDPEVGVADRREAAQRATLTPSPEIILMKKYEAAAISTFLRALRDFHKLDKAEAAAEVEPTQPATPREVAVATAPAASASSSVANEPRLACPNEPTAVPTVGDPDRSQSIPAAHPPLDREDSTLPGRSVPVADLR